MLSNPWFDLLKYIYLLIFSACFVQPTFQNLKRKHIIYHDIKQFYEDVNLGSRKLIKNENNHTLAALQISKYVN